MFEFQHSILSSPSPMTIPLSFLPHLPSPFFMQHSNNSPSRKKWYQRAIEGSMLWKTLAKPIEMTPWKTKTLTKTTHIATTATSSSRKLRKCRSTSRVASSFTHVCLCAPISSYTDTVVVSPTPTRSFSYQRSRSVSTTTRQEARCPSVERRKIFRGKSLTDDVLMRRLVIDEAMMQVRRRNEMEIIRRRSGMKKRKNGPSPLSRMVLAIEE